MHEFFDGNVKRKLCLSHFLNAMVDSKYLIILSTFLSDANKILAS